MPTRQARTAGVYNVTQVYAATNTQVFFKGGRPIPTPQVALTVCAGEYTCIHITSLHKLL